MGTKCLIEVEYSSPFHQRFREEALTMVAIRDITTGDLHKFAVDKVLYGTLERARLLEESLKISAERWMTDPDDKESREKVVEKLLEMGRLRLAKKKKEGG